VSYSSKISITELNGDQLRTVVLQGASLPLMGTDWAGEQKVSTTWYPGNGDEATQQVLGPREVPSHWHGNWKRTLMGRTDSVAQSGALSTGFGVLSNINQPWVLRDLLEDIFRAGTRLGVTWSVSSGGSSLAPEVSEFSFPPVDFEDIDTKIYREGRARTWKFAHDRAQDIRWEVEFDWLGRGRSQQKVTATRDDSASAAVDALGSATDALSSLIVPPLDPFSSFLRSIQRSVSALKGLVDTAKKFETVPLDIAGQIIDTARDVTAVCNQTIDSFGQQPPELSALKRKATDIGRAIEHFGQVSSASSLVSRSAATVVQKIGPRLAVSSLTGRLSPQDVNAVQSDVLAVYVTRFGDTPMRVSNQFYGTPDHSVDILRANRLPWYQPTLPAGQVLIIPNLQTIKTA
jgi:hypothetical protein